MKPPPLNDNDLGLRVVQLLRLIALAVGAVLVGLFRVVPEIRIQDFNMIK